MTRKVRLNEVSEPVRSFLSDALAGEGTLIEDESGRACGRLTPFAVATTAEQETAWRRLRAIQRKTRGRMEAAGRTEDELDRILQDEG